MLNPDEFRGVMRFLSALYPNKKIPVETMEAYYLILSDLGIDSLQASILRIASESKFFPSAAEIRSIAFDLQTAIPSAGEAWAEVEKQRYSCGHDEYPDFSHPAIGEAVRQVGGWRRLLRSTNHVADRARFLDLYREIAKKEQSEERDLPAVKGYLEAKRSGLTMAEKPLLLANFLEGIDDTPRT